MLIESCLEPKYVGDLSQSAKGVIELNPTQYNLVDLNTFSANCSRHRLLEVILDSLGLLLLYVANEVRRRLMRGNLNGCLNQALGLWSEKFESILVLRMIVRRMNIGTQKRNH